MVGEHLALKVVAFMLYYAAQETGELLLVLLEILVEPVQAHMFVAPHVLVDAGKREATFRATDERRILDNVEFRVDKNEFGILALREILGKGRTVDNHDADREADLRGGKTHAIAVIHGFKHIFDKLIQLRVIRFDVVGHLAQHRLAVKINR